MVLIHLSYSKIQVVDIKDVRNLLLNSNSHAKHNWESEIDETTYHMQYGFDTIEEVQFSIICRVGQDIIPGKISKGKASYTLNFEEKTCTHWRFVEGRLVHELDFQSVKCRRPLGRVGTDRFYNGVAHLKTGYVVGKVLSDLEYIEFSRNGIVETRKNNFYIIC